MYERICNLYHTTTLKKNYCASLIIKFTAVMQNVAWLKWYKIQKTKKCLKKLSPLNLINVIPYSPYSRCIQKTFVNSSINVFELKNYFTTVSCFNIQGVVPFVTTVFSDLNIPYIPLHCKK